MIRLIKEFISHREWSIDVPSEKDGRLILHTHNIKMTPLTSMVNFVLIGSLFSLGFDATQGNAVPIFIFGPIILGIFTIVNSYTKGEIDNVSRTFRLSINLFFLEWVVKEIQISEEAVLKVDMTTETYVKDGHTRTRRVCKFWAVDSDDEVLITNKHVNSTEYEVEIRKLSEILAKYLKLDVIMCNGGEEVEKRLNEQLDETVQQRLQKKLESGYEIPTLSEPLNLLSNIEDTYTSLRIEIPPIPKSIGFQRLGVITVFCLVCMPMGLLFSISMKIIGIQILAIFGAGLTIVMPCFYRDSIEIFEEKLFIVKGRKKYTIRVDELEEFLVEQPPDKSIGVGVFNQTFSGGLKAVSDVQQVQFAMHLSQQEIEYLHNRIIRRLTEHTH